MAQANAEQFLKDMESNADLRSEMMEHFDYDSGQWKSDAIVSAANSKGYAFNQDELKAAGESVYGGELSDEQLEMISGGGCCCSCCIVTCCCCTNA